MAQNLGNLLRVAIENSEGPPASISNPEDAAWLKEALSASYADPVKQMMADINTLKTMLSSKCPDLSEIRQVLEDLLTLTEDLDLANDFFKVGGTELLLTLLFNEPNSFREDALQLLANLTQNNPQAQQKCHDKDILPRLLLMLEEQDIKCNLGYVSKLILGISALVRTNPAGIAVFRESKGFETIMSILIHAADLESNDNRDQIERLLSRGSFLIFGILQDSPGDSLTDSERQILLKQIISLLMKIQNCQEYLLASSILLISKCENTESASLKMKSVDKRSLKLPGEMIKDFSAWLTQRNTELNQLNDSANEELQSYIKILVQTFS